MNQPLSQPLLPTTAIRSAFEQAARAHDAARTPQGAARQIASSHGATQVERAIASAAQQTSVDFDFLVAQAQVESAMNPEARAPTSSATGLYQFIESTWLNTMQRHGERFGLGNVAAQIGVTQSGNAYVADPVARAEILALRNDPQVAALMAAGLAEDNRAHLAPILGRQPDHGELYLAHFLGAGGAGRFLSAMADDPNQSAAALFRRPAAANRAVFYESNGAPRSLDGVMNYLSAKLERARDYAGSSMPQGYEAASLASPNISMPSTQHSGQRPPYLIADEAVFGPRIPPTITGSGTSPSGRITSGQSMSGILRDTFGSAGQLGSEASAAQVERAYVQLKALGL